MDIYKQLLAYLKPYRMRLVWALLFMGITSALIGGQTYLLKMVVDEGFVKRNKTLLLVIPFAYIVAAALKGIAMYVRDYLMGYVGQKVVNDIRDRLYSHVVSLSFSYFTGTPTGVIISRIVNDVNLVQGAITRAPASLGQGVLTMVGLMGWAFYLNWRLTLISLFVMPLAAVALSRFSRRFRKASTQMQERMGDLTMHLHETLAGIRIVKAFGAEQYERGRFAQKNRDLFNSLMRGIKTAAVSHPVMEIITVGGSAVVMELGFYYIYRGAMTAGDFVAFVMALLFLYRPLKDLNGVNNVVQDGLAAAKRIFEVLDTRPEIKDRDGALSLSRNFSTIEFRDLSFRYEDEPVLRNFSLTVSAGETVAVVGRSGGGKTTLVNLIPRFYDVTQGAILIDGTDIRNVTIESLRSCTAVVTQQTILFNDTVKNNIAYGLPGRSFDAVVRAAKAAHADDFIRSLPQGYDTVIGESGVKLSGGQRQRIAIARALLRDAPILILDEATSALDSESEREVQSALDVLMKGRTSFVIAHRLSTVLNADRIIVLKDGELAEQGRHADLLSRGGEYRHLYDQQFRDEHRAGKI
jgi:subfamily B ATP-binding cassette protein MsbA